MALAMSSPFFFHSDSDHNPLSRLSVMTVAMKRMWWSSAVQPSLSGWKMRYFALRELMASFVFWAILSLSASRAKTLRLRKSRPNSCQAPRMKTLPSHLCQCQLSGEGVGGGGLWWWRLLLELVGVLEGEKLEDQALVLLSEAGRPRQGDNMLLLLLLGRLAHCWREGIVVYVVLTALVIVEKWPRA